ncbi:Pyruvate kinase I [Anatilimnocola aggregata]|uniref:pyruvate kinase n=1 Tax=Anatilimnocola aggregata TaxID=2528021 RepID=A0A517YFG6_9BACT|nr:pyruvate kinase [Anatilimnocola aggregata]QDU28970.1 Pyruvate kinase I [Anatilimnocola aggregata]
MTTKNTIAIDLDSADIERVLEELMAIRTELVAAAAVSEPRLAEVHPNFRDSARNLLHYLALRRRDLRPLQLQLAKLGLSSLGRAESHVLATIDAVLRALHRLVHRTWQPSSQDATEIDFAAGLRLLSEHTTALLGVSAAKHGVRIMVTIPSEAAKNYTVVHELLQQGMDCMRINCSHDDALAWLQMIEHLRRAEQSLGRHCRIVMDLAGPKLRTGPLEPGPEVVRIRPQRDAYGHVTAAARIWLTAESGPRLPPSPATACLPVPAEWLAGLRPADRVKLTDARGAKRTWTVVDVSDGGCWAEATKTAYIVTATTLQHERDAVGGDLRNTQVGRLANCEKAILLRQGDLLIVTRDLKPGCPFRYDSEGQVLTGATIGCTIPEVFDDVRSGDPIWFDDGRIGGIVEKIESTQVFVRITQARVRGEKLRGDKGINLPESKLRLTALTAQDLKDLAFVAQHADVVELSFSNTAHDVESLQQQLARQGSRQPAIVLKIETRRGFDNLPEMLLTAMRAPSCGVMIARGDLAVECGFERLAEVQEEILWICEAAHIPVIWATQVLESLAKDGMPSRAEITDAAMGHRAECVMLNKGPYVVNAVRMLNDILQRMHAHQTKKQAMLRELRLAHTLPATSVPSDCD